MSKIVMTEQSSAPDTPGAGKVAIYVDTDGSLCWRRDDGTIAKIASAGTYTLTIPATGTTAQLGTAQTFTAAQTFGAEIKSTTGTALQLRPGSNSTTAIQLQNAAGTAILTVDTTNSLVKIGANTVPSISTALTTWTPAWTFATSGSVTLDIASGYYMVLGGLCFVFGRVRTSSISSPSGIATLNLPVAAANISPMLFSLTPGFVSTWQSDMPNLRLYATFNSSVLSIMKQATNSSSSPLLGSDFSASAGANSLTFFGAYPV